jgi:hypothetical protein
MSDWNWAGTHAMQYSCQTAKSNFVTTIARLNSMGQNMLALEISRCVASDDYRLEAAQSSAGVTQHESKETYPCWFVQIRVLERAAIL